MEIEQLDSQGVLLRQALYRFCAAALLFPEEERLETLANGAKWLAENLDGPWPRPELREQLLRLCQWYGDFAGDVETFQGEFVRLFGVSRTAFCYPYEGASIEVQQVGPLLMRLQQEYAQAGLQLATDDLPDHIGIELEYMSYLCGLELEAIHHGKVTRRRQICVRQLGFLSSHLCRWLPGLAERVSRFEGKIFAEICQAAARLTADEKFRLERICHVARCA